MGRLGATATCFFLWLSVSAHGCGDSAFREVVDAVEYGDGFVTTPVISYGSTRGSLAYPGDGFDKITGVVRESCLGQSAFSLAVRGGGSFTPNDMVVHGAEDVFRLVGVDNIINKSSGFDPFTHRESPIRSMFRDVEFGLDTIVIAAAPMYLKEMSMLTPVYGDEHAFNSASPSVCGDPKDFVGECGDAFVSQEVRGIFMLVVFEFDMPNGVAISRDLVWSAEAVANHLLMPGTSLQRFDQVDFDFIESYPLTIRCASVGGMADACADVSANGLGERIADFLGNADDMATLHLAVTDYANLDGAVTSDECMRVFVEREEMVSKLRIWIDLEDKCLRLGRTGENVTDALVAIENGISGCSGGDDLSICAQPDFWIIEACGAE